MTQEQTEKIWVVVKVCRGIPALVEVYHDRHLAYTREQILRKDMHPEYDETDVFETHIRDAIPSKT